MKIGEKIAIARKTKNLTQEQLADLLEVTRQAVSRWESDLAYPEMDKLVALSKILDINCDYLLKDDVTESGERIVQVEVIKKEVSLFQKLNWKFIFALLAVAIGVWLCALAVLYIVFNSTVLVDGFIPLILCVAICLAFGLISLVIGLVFCVKCIKIKEYFIKRQYKSK